KIEVEGGTESERSVFYTSLYRTYERMINISEDGHYYSATDGQIHEDEGTPFYTDDWIWDTYLAVHPLRILIDPIRQQHMLTSYLRVADQTKEGWLPTFPEVTGDTHRMNGNHG
ncbi:glycoside hydrolase domain-containing protein, partial [Klebsiella pneumoniae]|uniref:glycoside hydrolase domain-containing protein n=2 Tax=Pseudomonadati TaxID=3379134 RepID=UPI0025554728